MFKRANGESLWREDELGVERMWMWMMLNGNLEGEARSRMHMSTFLDRWRRDIIES
jgi:hypothetical protein